VGEVAAGLNEPGLPFGIIKGLEVGADDVGADDVTRATGLTVGILIGFSDGILVGLLVRATVGLSVESVAGPAVDEVMGYPVTREALGWPLATEGVSVVGLRVLGLSIEPSVEEEGAPVTRLLVGELEG